MRGSLADAIQRGKFGKRHSGAVHAHRGTLTAFQTFIVKCKEEFLTGQQVLHDGHSLLAEETFIVRDKGEPERMQRADVFHRTVRVGIIEGLVGRVKIAPRAEHKIEHILQCRVEQGERVFTPVTETTHIPRDLLKGLA